MNTAVNILLALSGLIIFILFARHYNIASHSEIDSERPVNPILSALYGFAGGILTMAGVGGQDPVKTLLSEDLNDREKIRNTSIISLTLPLTAGALLMTGYIRFDSGTFLTVAVSGVLGIITAYFLNIRLSQLKTREYLAFLMLILGTILIYRKFHYLPQVTAVYRLTGYDMALGAMGNFLMGILLYQGIAVYAPLSGIFITLGVSPRSAYTVTAAACAFMLTVLSVKIITEGKYYKRAAFILGIGGMAGVYSGFGFFREMTIEMVRWAVIVAVIYGAIANLMEIFRDEEVIPEADTEELILDNNIQVKTEIKR